jgi:putative ABC transport system ATP-binding protein
MERIGSLLSAHGLGRDYGTGEALVRAVNGIDLDVIGGETVAVMGPSGCGKSTLLYLLGGLERPSAGELRLAGHRMDQMSERSLARLRRTAIGFVFQAFHLVEELTAAENVELPALLAGRSPRTARARAVELLEQVGMSNRAQHLPSALSGGQRQRVAIARAILADPAILILDEATSSLDSESESLIQEGLARLRAGRTTFVIAHRLSTITSADQILVLEAGEIVERGSHDELLDLGGRYRALYERQYRQALDRYVNPGEELKGAASLRP